MTLREATYAALAALGLLATAYFNVMYFVHGGNFDPIEYLSFAWQNPASRSLTSDIFVAFTVFSVWVVVESRRIGMRRGWIYPLIGLVTAFAFVFPLFLLLRERHLSRQSQTT